MRRLWLFALLFMHPSPAAPVHDLVIRGGMIYDGSGRAPSLGDLAIQGDSIVAVGRVEGRGWREVDATGLAVAPGFINVLSWAAVPLLHDGRSQSDVRQGVTLEVFGEGTSLGPLTDAMKQNLLESQGDIRYDVRWTTLAEGLRNLVDRGVSTNVASFVGATTLRINVIGYENRAPTPRELDRMRALVRQAMEEGALGLGTSLIYTPATFAKTDELIELSKVAAEFGGMYITHMRDEGGGLLEAVEEVLAIARGAGIRAEIYHLKASGRRNWGKMDTVIARIEEARRAGLQITADMYTYPASSTGLDAAMPAWVQEGGHRAWVERLRRPEVRARVMREMRGDAGFDNAFANAGGAEGVLLVGFRQDSLKYLQGKTLAEVAAMRGASPEETAMDLVVQDDSRVQCVYFTMSEDNVRKQIALPWVSFGSDGGSYSAEGLFLRSSTHPRAYGNFARLLGRYVREERVIPLEEAVRRLTTLPAGNLRLARRGALRPGHYADVVVFDPATISDHATFDRPHQYATGVRDVWVNGVQVLADGEHTGARPGRVVPGPGVRAR